MSHTDCPGRTNRLNKTRIRLKIGLLADMAPMSSKRAVAARTIEDEASMWMPRASGKFASASMAQGTLRRAIDFGRERTRRKVNETWCWSAPSSHWLAVGGRINPKADAPNSRPHNAKRELPLQTSTAPISSITTTSPQPWLPSSRTIRMSFRHWRSAN